MCRAESLPAAAAASGPHEVPTLANAVDAVDTVDTVDTDDTVDTVGATDTSDAVDTTDGADGADGADVADVADAADAVDAAGPADSVVANTVASCLRLESNNDNDVSCNSIIIVYWMNELEIGRLNRCINYH